MQLLANIMFVSGLLYCITLFEQISFMLKIVTPMWKASITNKKLKSKNRPVLSELF